MQQHQSAKGGALSLLRRLLCHPKFRENNAPSLLLLAVFSLLLLSRLLDTALLGREEKYLSIIVLQLLIFLLPALVYCKLLGRDFTARLPLRAPRPTHILFMISALVVMIAGGLLISIHTGGIDGSARGFTLYETFVADSASSAGAVLYHLLAFAALPALCEEMVFRGILLTSLQTRGTVCAFAFSSLYFGMLHFDFAQLPVYMFAGLVLCLVTRVTRSLPAAMAVHFLYNIFGLFGQSALARFYSYSGNDAMFKFLLTLFLLIGAALLCGQASRIYHRYAADSLPPPDISEPPLPTLPAALLRTLFPVAGLICIGLYVLVTLLG